MEDKEFLINMGKKIRKIRIQKGMTLRNIEALKVTDFGHMCRIENGKVASSVLTLKKLAVAMNVKVKDFL